MLKFSSKEYKVSLGSPGNAMGDCKLLKRFMDRDLYYKYSELRLIKHPTSLSYNQNIVNNHGELD